METIVLKDNKSRFKKWIKRIFISAAIISIITFFSCLRIRYEYYKIDPDLNRTTLGISADKGLKYDAEIARIEKAKEDGYLIGSFDYEDIVEYKWVIKWFKTPTNDKQIVSSIEDSVCITVYASQITLNNQVYFLNEKDMSSLISKLNELYPEENFNAKMTFVNINKISNDIDKIIANYQSTIDNK